MTGTRPPREPPWFPPSFARDAWTIPRRAGGRAGTRMIEPAIMALARTQHGVVGRRQLLALGVSSRNIQVRLEASALRVAYPGVYAVGGLPLGPDGRRLAGVLACRRGAQLAGWTGATHHALLPEAGGRLDIAIPTERRVELPGLEIVRARPRATEQTLVRNVPTHTVARVLLDLARRTDDGEVLEWAWRQAIYLRALELREVLRIIADHAGEPGVPALRDMYRRRRKLAGELRNRFEILMLSIIREAGLPEPLCNVPWDVGGGLILTPDFRIPSLRLVVESDGRDGHEDVEFLLTDDERDARYAALGHATLRYTYWEATRERGRVAGELTRFARRARGATARNPATPGGW